MNLDEPQAYVEVYEDTFIQWALWWLMIAFVGGFIIGMILISVLG